MDRKALKLPFSIKRCPDWRCPTCGTGVLRLKEESFNKAERRASRDHSHEAWEPEWIEYVYSCLFICNNDRCKEVISSIGVGGVEPYDYVDDKGEYCQEWDDFFKPKHFEPALILLSIPPNCPESVSTPLRESFRLFFSSPSAASNNVRIAIEALLTDLGVRRYKLVKKRRTHMSLHQRIGLLSAKYADLQPLMRAIKWLGNAGSHNTESGREAISMDDVMDSYEMTEHVLQEVYASKTRKLLALAKKVNKKKGPAK